MQYAPDWAESCGSRTPRFAFWLAHARTLALHCIEPASQERIRRVTPFSFLPWSYTVHSVHYTRRVGATTIRWTGQRCLGSHERTHYALKQRTMGWTRFWRRILIYCLSLIARYFLNFRTIVLWLLERYFLKMHKNHRIRKYLNPLCDTTIALTFY